jgi:hypothetical protein
MRERLDERSHGDRAAWLGAVGAVAESRRKAPRPELVAAGVAGGVVMGVAKVTAAVAAVVLLAAVAWWTIPAADEASSGEASDAAAPAETADAAATAPTAKRQRARAPVATARDGVTSSESAELPADAAASERDPAADAERAAAPRELRLRVLDEQGAPVAGATVRIVSAGRARMLLRAVAEATAKTDENGRFEVFVPPGSLVARVSLDGFADFQAGVADGDSDLRVRLVPAWTLRGTVVAQETGRGVKGILVNALRAGTDELLVATRSDESGAFALAALPDEAVDLALTEPDEFVSIALPEPDAGAASGLEEVRFTDGRRFAPARVKAVAPRSPELRVELLAGRSIAGTLVDDAGAAVTTHVVLEVIRRTAQGGPDYTTRRRIDIRDPGGAFRLDGLAEGEYDLSFLPAEAEAAGGPSFGAIRVPAVKTGTADLRVVFVVGTPLRLRVVDPDGKPLDGGFLYVHAPGRPVGEHGTVIAAPRLEGRYVTPPLDRSKTFDLLATGFAGHFQAKRTGLRPGEDEVVVTLERAGRISGRVFDEQDRPVGAGVPVSAAAQGVAAGVQGGGWVAYTDAAGAFVLDPLGDHAFKLTAGGASSGFVNAGSLRDVRPGRTDAVLRVRKGVAFTGRLVDAEGKPVRTHLLSAAPAVPDGEISSTTKIDGEDGRFVFRGVRAGRVRVSCFVGESFVVIGEVEAPATDVQLVLPAR